MIFSFIFVYNYSFKLWKYGKLLTMKDYHHRIFRIYDVVSLGELNRMVIVEEIICSRQNCIFGR